MNEYRELIEIISFKLKEELYFKIIDKNKYCIYGSDVLDGDGRFTQINFRIEENSLIIPWLYLSMSNTGCGYEIISWFEKYCLRNDLEYIEIRLVDINNINMIKLMDKLDFNVKNINDDKINFIKCIK